MGAKQVDVIAQKSDKGSYRARPSSPTIIHRSAWKTNSPKFAVASDPPSAALCPRERHGSTTSEPKRPDQVAFVAPLRIKELRLVTLQLPEKFSPIGPGLSDDREMATWQRWIWSPGRGAALFAALGLWVSQRLGGPLSFLLYPFTGPPALLAGSLAVLAVWSGAMPKFAYTAFSEVPLEYAGTSLPSLSHAGLRATNAAWAPGRRYRP